MGNMKSPWWSAMLAETRPLPPSCAEQIAVYNATHPGNAAIQHAVVANHNACDDLVIAASPDIILFGTSRIIKKNILAIPKMGYVNCHPAILPGYRGAVVFIRQILDDLPLGMTCHWATAELDQGPIISTRHVPVLRSETLSHVMWKLLESAVDQVVDAFRLIEEGSLEAGAGTSQLLTKTPCFAWPEEDLIFSARMKLENGTYAHILDIESRV